MSQTHFTNGYALIIGVGNDLPVTVADATVINAILTDPLRAAYPSDQVSLLTEEAASKKGIEEGLQKFVAQVNANPSKDKTVIVYYSGHGGVDSKNQKYYLVPNDASSQGYVEGDFFVDCINQIDSRRIVVLLDCCHAGGFKPVPAIKNAINPLKDALQQGKGKLIIASSSEEEYSYLSTNYSTFTEVLVEALDGRFVHDPNEKYIHILSLADYVTKEVPKRKPKQNPQINNASSLTNFPICAFDYATSKSQPFIPVQIDPTKPQRPLLDAIIELIDTDMEAALDELDKVNWGNRRGTYNDLKEEWINRPVSFSATQFRSRLKVFVKSYWK